MNMTKIFHWVFGSFFRTLGRILGYLIIGVILALILSHAKLPKVSDIFNDIFFMKVDAATFTQEIKQTGTYYLNIDSYDGFASSSEYLNKTIVANNNIITANFVLNSEAISNIKNHDYVQFNFMITNSGQGTNYDGYTITSHTCKYWSCPTTNTLTLCTCTDYDNEDSQAWDVEMEGTANFNSQNISARIDYNGWYAPCNVQNNNIICPTYNQNYYKVILNIAYQDNQSNSPRIYIPRTMAVLDNVNTANDIINNQNSNTNSIINNQNQTTQEIINSQQASTNATIENQNQNTQQQIHSNQVCQFIDKNSIKIQNKFLNANGNESNSNNWGITDYISTIKTDIKVLAKAGSTTSYYCFYNTNKTLLNCYTNDTMVNNQNLVIPENASYVRFSISPILNQPQLQVCTNGNQAMANTITDESGPSNISSLSNDNMVGWLPPGPVDSLINLPLVLLNSLQNALSSSCSPVTLTLPFVNSDIVLPCMSSLYESMGVSSFVNWAGIVASAFILFSYLIRFYKWVDNTLTFRENNWLDNWGGE